ncbi:TetR/AcrR family transcriptional regulator [Longimonas halophila]|nr:TetR/AcrR family transcriptional regulator [Longimonas halophila]
MAATKGERTRADIIRQSAALFNRRGYARASMSDITEVTGIKRGGIYNHFGSKDELAVESFQFAAEKLIDGLEQTIDAHDDVRMGLRSIATAFAQVYDEGWTFAGGCPILNTAVETRGQDGALRSAVQEAMAALHELVRTTVADGVARGTIADDVQPAEGATVFISTIEGALLLSALSEDRSHLEHAVAHLHRLIDQWAVPSESEPTS